MSEKTPNNRILYLSGDVESSNISEVCKQILDIQHEDMLGEKTYKVWEYKPIQLHVQSFGGSVYDMWSLIDIMESSPTPIMTYCSGYCMSAAALIFLAGHIRCMYENSSIMLHQLSSMEFGKFRELEMQQSNLEQIHKRLMKYIKKHTNLPKKYLKKIDEKREDVYLTAKQCLKFGICDDIITKTNWRDQLLQTLQTESVSEQVILEEAEDE